MECPEGLVRSETGGGNGSPNGLDRPAFVLGDLNQIGPKGVSLVSPVSDVEFWVNDTSNETGFGAEYQVMRQKLGNWLLSEFDQANGWGWDLYDLAARNINGTWIGNGTESSMPDTSANDCITIGQVTGYDTVSELPQEARLDYIMVLPAQGNFPFYTLVGPDSNPTEPVVAINANPGDWTDGLGCASDHAQVTASIGLVQTVVKANYNPKKKHRLTYRVTHLWDFNDADGEDTDWFVRNPDFAIERRNASNVVVEAWYKGYSDDSTPDGVAVPVEWYDWIYPTGKDKVRAGVTVWDNDWASSNDVYDGSGFEYGSDTYFFFTGGLTFNGTTPLGTADPSSSDPDGSCRNGCLGVATYGDGDGSHEDNDVKVTQNLLLEEVE